MNSGKGSRRALRRAVQLECGVFSRWWSGPLRFEATDLSAHGLWLDTDLALEASESVHVRLTPPRWPVWAPPLQVHARVARVALSRRRGDRSRPGMGLAFVGLSPVETGLLALALRGLPPPLPSARMRRPQDVSSPISLVSKSVAPPTHQVQQLSQPSKLATSADTVDLRFVALGPFLTAGRIVVPPPAGRAVVIPFPTPATPASPGAAPVALRLVRLRECDALRSR